MHGFWNWSRKKRIVVEKRMISGLPKLLKLRSWSEQSGERKEPLTVKSYLPIPGMLSWELEIENT